VIRSETSPLDKVYIGKKILKNFNNFSKKNLESIKQNPVPTFCFDLNDDNLLLGMQEEWSHTDDALQSGRAKESAHPMGSSETGKLLKKSGPNKTSDAFLLNEESNDQTELTAGKKALDPSNQLTIFTAPNSTRKWVDRSRQLMLLQHLRRLEPQLLRS
jgi:hypothetical protein